MARPTVRILGRYLLRQHLAPLAFALAAFTCFMLVQQVARQFGNLAGKGLPAGVIAELFALSIPFIVAMTLPMAVLVAVLHVFTHLGADNEITAMKASGVSVGRMLAPVIAGAAVVSLLSIVWNDQVLPRANHRLRTLLGDIQRKRPSLSLKEQIINPVIPERFYLRAARIDQGSNRLRDVTIYDLGDAARRRVISADSGRMAYTPDGRDLYLTLFDGDVREVREDPTQFNRTFYHTNRIRVAGVGNLFQRTGEDTYRGDREMTICDMEKVAAGARREAERSRAEARLVGANDLRRLVGLAPLPPRLPADPEDDAGPAPPPGLYCQLLAAVARTVRPDSASAQTPGRTAPGQTPRPATLHQARPPSVGGPLVTPGGAAANELQARVADQRAAMYAVEIHKKLAISAACLVFALAGVPLALRFPRGGVGLVLLVSSSVFTIYYIGLIGGEELGDRLIVSPFVAMWTPNLILAALGLTGLALARRAGSTPYGGDWEDLTFALRRWARRLARPFP